MLNTEIKCKLIVWIKHTRLRNISAAIALHLSSISNIQMQKHQFAWHFKLTKIAFVPMHFDTYSQPNTTRTLYGWVQRTMDRKLLVVAWKWQASSISISIDKNITYVAWFHFNERFQVFGECDHVWCEDCRGTSSAIVSCLKIGSCLTCTMYTFTHKYTTLSYVVSQENRSFTFCLDVPFMQSTFSLVLGLQYNIIFNSIYSILFSFDMTAFDTQHHFQYSWGSSTTTQKKIILT